MQFTVNILGIRDSCLSEANSKDNNNLDNW